MSTSSSPTAPIFIGGVIKSGTSLLRAMLGKHSNIAAGLETYWFDMRLNGTPESQKEALPGRVENELEHQLERLAKFFDLSRDAVMRIAAESDSSERFLDRFMATYAQSLGKPRWLEKTPGNILHVDRIRAAWPDAMMLFCTRNPLDVYASCLQAGRWEDPKLFAGIWCDYFEAYRSFSESGLLIAENCRSVSYENLIADPAGEIAGVLEFLGEPFEAGVAVYEGQSRDFDIVHSVTGKKSTTLERMKAPLQKDRVGIFHETVSSAQVAAIEKVVIERNLHSVWKGLTQ